MGFFDFAKKVGKAVGGAVKKVGQVVSPIAKKVGDIGGKVVDVAKKIQPFVQDIPVVGNVVGAVAKAGDIVDLAKDIGAGRYQEALQKGVNYASGRVPGLGQALGRYEQIRNVAGMAGVNLPNVPKPSIPSWMSRRLTSVYVPDVD